MVTVWYYLYRVWLPIHHFAFTFTFSDNINDIRAMQPCMVMRSGVLMGRKMSSSKCKWATMYYELL